MKIALRMAEVQLVGEIEEVEAGGCSLHVASTGEAGRSVRFDVTAHDCSET